MFTITTSEIRWFFKGNIPEEIDSWLKTLKGGIDSQPPRTDVYLNIQDSPNLGIKFREGRFEVKQKMTDFGELNTSNVAGIAELWKKWSFEANDEKIPLADISKGEWIQISKSRKLKKYIFTKSGEIIPGFDNYQSDGCNLELTKVKIYPLDNLKASDKSSTIWWTLGLETYGHQKTLLQNLSKAFEHLFKKGFPIVLKVDQSFGYPKWLSL